MIDPTFTKINRLFVLSFRNGDDYSIRNYFDEYYMPLVEIKDFNALIDNKPFSDYSVKNKQEANEIFFLKCQETIIIQQGTY